MCVEYSLVCTNCQKVIPFRIDECPKPVLVHGQCRWLEKSRLSIPCDSCKRAAARTSNRVIQNALPHRISANTKTKLTRFARAESCEFNWLLVKNTTRRPALDVLIVGCVIPYGQLSMVLLSISVMEGWGGGVIQM
jgi:hypothetical protein